MFKLLVATQNKGKLHEFKALLQDLSIEILSPDQVNLDLDVKEDGKTYKQNVTKKVLAFAQAVKRNIDEPKLFLTLADDSGLEVDLLGGQPGLYSARFTRKHQATDADRRSYLLNQLRQYPPPWTARFRCIVALHIPGSGVNYAEGICPGMIIPEERGTNGFGYDPIFLVDGTDCTMAELNTEEKNRLSHRGRAVMAIKPVLVGILDQ